MICPYCGLKLVYLDTNFPGSVKESLFFCNLCERNFEKHTIKDKLGIVRDESLYELNKDGDFCNSW